MFAGPVFCATPSVDGVLVTGIRWRTRSKCGATSDQCQPTGHRRSNTAGGLVWNSMPLNTLLPPSPMPWYAKPVSVS
jgi:hypothetical protein